MYVNIVVLRRSKKVHRQNERKHLKIKYLVKDISRKHHELL